MKTVTPNLIKRIKYFVMDVDGTLTDGKIYMGKDGEIIKAFDIKDGTGIVNLLPKLDITPVIITGRRSTILENRCRELNIKEVYQGIDDKLNKLIEIVGNKLDIVAYVGDDIPDLRCMKTVKRNGGIVMCPRNAIPEIKELSDYVSGYKAGEGAIRDCINYLYYKDEIESNNSLENIIDQIKNIKSEDDIRKLSSIYKGFCVRTYVTREEDACVIETNNTHGEVQYMIEGRERIKTYLASSVLFSETKENDSKTDCWKGGVVSTQIEMIPGSVLIINKGQPFKEAIAADGPMTVKKIVYKY